MTYLPISRESLNQAAEILRNGGIVAFPTETVYGLGADAFNPQALARVFEAKGRPRFDPLIIHIAAVETLERVADLSLLDVEARKKLFTLVENLWPGPLSIVLPKNEKIPGLATAGLPTAAIRFPCHDAAQKLISLSTGAIAAPSANPFGSLSPTMAEHVRDGLGGKVDMILDGGATRIGLESTVLDITGGSFRILRPGGTPREAIERLIGTVQRTENNEQITNNNDQLAEDSEQAPFPTSNSRLPTPDSQLPTPSLASPGLLKSHYAPKTPLFVLNGEAIIQKSYEKDCAFLFFDGFTRDSWLKTQKISEKMPRERSDKPKNACFRVLSESGQALQAASRLFETLHELDNGGFSRIFAQFAPSEGLGEAVNDRLQRASVLN